MLQPRISTKLKLSWILYWCTVVDHNHSSINQISWWRLWYFLRQQV